MRRPKGFGLLLLAAAIAIGMIGGLIWDILEIDDCFDRSGIVVFPLTRYQECEIALERGEELRPTAGDETRNDRR